MDWLIVLALMLVGGWVGHRLDLAAKRRAELEERVRRLEEELHQG